MWRGACDVLPLCSGGNGLAAQVKDTKTAMRWAMAVLGVARLMCKKPAVCFDIDGTVIINDDRSRIIKCENYMKQVVDTCYTNHITVFYVTARPESPSNRRSTERELASAGLGKHARLYMMPETGGDDYKWRCRRDIERQGYTIILSVGDQWWDLAREVPKDLQGKKHDSSIFVGCLGDEGRSWGIKLPSEFARQDQAEDTSTPA